MQISKQTTNSRPMHSQLQSPLFRLPAEIRTAIYEYAFMVVFDCDRTINMRSEALPSRSLPLTCLRIHQESAAMQHQAYNDFLNGKSYNNIWNDAGNWKMVYKFKLEINIARDNLNNIQLHDICGVSDEEFRYLDQHQVVLILNLDFSENANPSHIKLRLSKLCGIWESEVTCNHGELSEAAARRDLNVKLHKLIQSDFEELQHYVERTDNTVRTWAAALWPTGSKHDDLKMLLRGYMEWLNIFLNKLRKEFDDAQPRDESGALYNRAARRRIKREQLKNGTYREPPSEEYSSAPTWPVTPHRGFGRLLLDARRSLFYDDVSHDKMFGREPALPLQRLNTPRDYCSLTSSSQLPIDDDFEPRPRALYSQFDRRERSTLARRLGQLPSSR